MKRSLAHIWICCGVALCTIVFVRVGAGQKFENLMGRARIAIREGRLQAAETILDAIRRNRADDPKPYLALGDLAFVRREYARGVQLYGKALGLTPGNPKILVGLAKWSYFAGDLESARRRLREALNRNPTDPESRAYLTYLGESVDWPKEIGKAAASKEISRGEMAGLLVVQMTDQEGLWENPFTPVLTDISSHWGRDLILSAVRKGWMVARPDHTFGPDDGMTRATLARVLYNIFYREGVNVEDLSHISRPSDMSPHHLFLRAVMFALEWQLMQKNEDDAFSPLGRVAGVEAIEAVERAKRLLYPMGMEGG